MLNRQQETFHRPQEKTFYTNTDSRSSKERVIKIGKRKAKEKRNRECDFIQRPTFSFCKVYLGTLHWLSVFEGWNNFNVILITTAAFISTYTDCSKMFRQHLFVCSILFYLHKRVKRNITPGQGNLPGCSKSAFLCHPSQGEGGSQMALPANISCHVLKLLKEGLLRFLNIKLNVFWNIKTYDLGVEMLYTSSPFKAPNVHSMWVPWN